MSLGSLLWTVPTEVDASGKGANSSSKMKPVGDDERDAIYYLRAYPSYFLWPREEGGCERCLEDVPLGARFSIRTKGIWKGCCLRDMWYYYTLCPALFVSHFVLSFHVSLCAHS